MTPAREPHVPFAERCAYPARPGNAVRALIDGEPAFRRICAAIAAARHSVWATVAFLTPDFQMPDRQGDLFDVLDRAGQRGVDVRVVFWRPNPQTQVYEPRTFWGSLEQRRMLAERAPRISLRWDRAHGSYCQHQKSWLIDAGQDGEVAFIGGINLNPRSVVAPGHTGGGEHENHDAYLELAGPSASDVHRNFVQRWNEASERQLEGGTWGQGGREALAEPEAAAAPRGPSTVQVQRTLHARRYRRSHPDGEASILEQYLLAIGAARRSIYLENQAFEVREIAEALRQALERGVEVVFLAPAEPEAALNIAPTPERLAFLEARAALAAYPHFTLAGIAGLDARGRRRDVYVHAKLMIVDDAWATIGSGNLHGYSLFGSTEMNAAVWDPAFARALRCELFAEHLGLDTDGLDDMQALRLFRRIAAENRGKRAAGKGDWQGSAFALDPAIYGRAA
jgi:phosphatidylserine/phosphatidylglycerophosphate/cardiolipin synthase-like enzyme